MRNLVKEAIVEAVGIRCPDHDADCLTCQTWGQFDALEAAQAQAAEVRRETVEECAQHLTTLADAMHEKAEAIADRSSRHGPFVRPLTSERDAAVMAYDFEQAATAIRALTNAAKGSDHLPDREHNRSPRQFARGN